VIGALFSLVMLTLLRVLERRHRHDEDFTA
jgi:hypothetical protein